MILSLRSSDSVRCEVWSMEGLSKASFLQQPKSCTWPHSVLSFQGTKSPGKLTAREIFCPRQKSVFANICITKVPTALDPADQTQSCHFSQMCSAPYFSPSCSVTAPTKHQDIVSTEGKCGRFTHPELNSSPANTWTLLCFGISEVTFWHVSAWSGQTDITLPF